MGFSTPKVPETISDAEMAGLSRRAQKAQPESIYSRKAVEQRQRSAEQQERRDLS